MSDPELLLKHRVNPMLVLSNTMKGILGGPHSFLDESWDVFSDYVTYKFLRGDEGEVKRVVLEAEELAQKFVKVFQEIPSDSMLEASALLYFILASEGISRRYEDVLVKPSLNLISRRIEDYNRGVVLLDSSPALSKCIGLSYIFEDKLSEKYVKELTELLGLCDRPEPQHQYFCLYAMLSNTLKAILSGEKGGLLCKRVAKVSQLFSKYGIPETITLMFLIVGLSQYVGCRNEAISLKLFQKLLKVFELNSRTLTRRSRKMWTVFSLALELNKLKKLAYVPEGYVVLRKDVAERIVGILNAERKKTEDLMMYFSVFITFISLLPISKILEDVAGIVLPISIVRMSSVLAVVALALIVIFLVIRHREIRKLLDEPDIKKLLNEIGREVG